MSFQESFLCELLNKILKQANKNTFETIFLNEFSKDLKKKFID